MTSQPIVESGMTFGPFPEGHCFYIEQSATYREIQTGLKMVELLLARPSQDSSSLVIWAVEAKASSPQPGNNERFDQFIGEICEKLSNALSLSFSILLGRHETFEQELSETFKKLDPFSVDFRLVLVVNGHRPAWLPPLQEALRKALRPVVDTWALSAKTVVVLNDDGAREYGLTREE